MVVDGMERKNWKWTKGEVRDDFGMLLIRICAAAGLLVREEKRG